VLLALITRAGADTIDDLVGQVSVDQVRAHLTALPAPRDTSAAQAAAADYIVRQLQSYGYTVTQDPVLQSANLIVHIPGERVPELTFVVGAHFDSVGGSPGADDNAAAVAGILEMARVLAGQHLAASIDLVAFAAEEAGLVGSGQYAQEARDALREISGMLSLEMIAYTCTRPGCQFAVPSIPNCLQIDHPMPSVGTFIAGVGNDASHDLLQTFQTAAARYVPQLSVDTGQVTGLGSCLPDTRRSDHASFWTEDYRALMITDTANYRNPNYHKPTDTLQTLDLTLATQVTQAALATALRVAGLASDPVPTPTVTRARTPLPTRTPIPPGAHVLLYAGAIIDTADQRVVGTMPATGTAVTAAPDGRSLYVSNNRFGPGGTVSVIDTATNVVVSTIAVDNPGRVAFTPDGRFAYVASSGNWPSTGSIVVIDTASYARGATIPTQAIFLGGPVTSPDGQFVYFTDPNHSTVSMIATATNSIVASFAVGENFSAFGSYGPLDIAFTPDGAVAYAANEESATVSAIDTASNAVTKNILVHQDPGALAMTPDGTKAYVEVCCFNNPHQLDVIDTSLNRVTHSIDLPATASSLAITPDGRSLYVNSCPHIFVVDTATDTITNILFIEECASPMAIAAVPNLPPLTPYPTLTPAPTGLPPTASPTGTPTAVACSGDCNGDGTVTIDEILTIVNIALGNTGVSACGAADANHDGYITVDEALLAVNNALNGCHPLPTPTPTPTFGGCGDTCDGRTCLASVFGLIGTCTGVSEQGCDCVPYSAGATATATPAPARAGQINADS
jgi:YVTN family beta-propeller protein